MMRSLYSGVSGLKTHQTKMDVIGNNIANVNTTSYKTMQINFSDLMYQTSQAATGPNSTTGTAGTNPRQIGLGVQTAAISTKITEEGATQSTGNPFDLKISGDEFFVVSDGTNTYFTRDGSFYVDAAGNLAMSSTGYNVMGWQVDPETGNIKKDTVSPLVVLGPDYMTYEAEMTTAATASGLIDWNDPDQGEKAGKTLNLQIYDNLGYSYTVKMSLHNAVEGKEGKENYTFYTTVDSIVDSTNKKIYDSTDPNDAKKISFGSSRDVDLDGQEIKATTNITTKTVYYKHGITGEATSTTIAYATVKDPANNNTITYLVYAADYSGATTYYTSPDTMDATTDIKAQLNLDSKNNLQSNIGNGLNVDAYNKLFNQKNGVEYGDILKASVDKNGIITVTRRSIDDCVVLNFNAQSGKYVSTSEGDSPTINLSGLGKSFSEVKLDFSKVVVADNGGKSTITVEKGDIDENNTGRSIGTMQGVSIQTNGMIYASYTNGQKRLLGQIAVAEFANASGLQKEGDNLYSETNNSGSFNGIGIDITANGDKMNTGVLEMSNVDLSSEFTDMITTQRGFQANSRIITVSDTLLEELVNLKR